MDKQIQEQMYKAFFDLLEEDASSEKLIHITKLLDEIKVILKSFVPSRLDIHSQIDQTITNPTWDVQEKLVSWIEKFQSPQHDKMTSKWKKELPTNISTFLKQYYQHLEVVNKEVYEARTKLANGENLFQTSNDKQNNNGIPEKIQSGR
uniref:Uncharacterized protein n=1 Tax=viral metagenome TaxID=1070528 RepID=A0A6C0FCT0_9ZZZZ|tara:strand:+ start:1855 stop:2301 length:447 start_codon:yes stop_codon:yes gene_type:complete